MLVNDMRPNFGEILINGENINEVQVRKSFSSFESISRSTQERQVEIGFCPQFDWLIEDLTVNETLLFFAR